jgi:hypothetical protein
MCGLNRTHRLSVKLIVHLCEIHRKILRKIAHKIPVCV